MQRLPGDRSWTVSRAVRSGDYDRPQRRTKAKPSIIFCVGDRRKSKKIPGEHNLHVTERHTSVTGNTCNEIQPSQNMKRSPWTLRRRSGPQQHPRLPNPSRFTGFVVREHLASDERGRSASQSSGSGETLRQKFSHHHRQLCSLRSVRMTTDLPGDCRRAPRKKCIVAGQNKRDDCFLLFHDDTMQSPSRSMRRSR